MECMKDDWECIHNGECSKEFIYKIHTFVGALEISVEDIDVDLSASKSSIFDEKIVTFPRLVILRPKCLTNLKDIVNTKNVEEYKKKRQNDELIDYYLNKNSQSINLETEQLIEFSNNCIFEIKSKEDIPLLIELRNIYGPPEFLDSENNIDNNIIGNLLEKDESGILIVNPWDNNNKLNSNINELKKINTTSRMESNSYSNIIEDQFNNKNQLIDNIDLSTYSTATIQVLAIFGIIFVFEEPYLLISTNRERSSVIYQNGKYKTINRVTKCLALPLLSNSLEDKFININNQELDKKYLNKNNDLKLIHLDQDEFNFKDFTVNQNDKNKDKIEWMNRISQTLQKMSPIKNKKETFSSILGESGAHWLSNSIFNVSSGILDSVTTAFSNTSQQNNIKNIDIKDLKNDNFIVNELQDNSKESNVPFSLEEMLIERKNNLQRLLEGVTKMISSGGFYYSFDLDLTHTLQRKFENSFQDYIERVGTYDKDYELSSKIRNKAYIITGDSRFIWNENISIPMLISGIDPRWVTPLVQGYFCNQAIVISPEGPGYVKIGSEILTLKMNSINSFINIDTEQNQKKDYIKNYKCRMCYQDHIESLTRYDIVLMSRRAWERGGTRFNARGIDDDANVANFVESELQICINNSNHWFSFVQIRGSIPLFWEQTGVNSCAITCFDHDYSSMIFEKHHQKLVSLYGQIFYINLLGSSTHEQALSMGLKKEINYYNLNINDKFDNISYFEDSSTGLICNFTFDNSDFNINSNEDNEFDKCRNSFCFCSYKAIPILYSNYDYHNKVKNLGFENALNEYVSYLAKEIGNKLGYFHGVFKENKFKIKKNQNLVEFANLLDLKDEDYSVFNINNNNNNNNNEESLNNEFIIKQRQKGVIRTNCLDCLDRTNALQWYISWTWFIDLILSISTCSIKIDINDTYEIKDNQNYYLFIKSLFNSQLSHFGWFNLENLNLNDNKNKDFQMNFTSSKSNSNFESFTNFSNKSKISSSYTVGEFSTVKNNDFQSNNSINFKDLNIKCNRNLSSRTERHSFIMGRKTNYQTNESSISNNLINYNLSNYNSSQLNIDNKKSEILDINKNSKTRFDEFKNCLLNGMGIVTLKDSFSLLWAENGDMISELYTGVGSVFSGVIRNRKVSLSTNFDHALKSLRRLYHNAFEDSSRQQYIDCLLFKHPSNSGINICTTEKFNKNKIINFNSLNNSKKYINNHKLTIWIGTWNLAGQSLQVSLDSWIKSNIPKNTSIVCFCLQELVELSGVRVMFNQNDKNREASFEIFAMKALGNNEYIKLQSSSLVGLFCVIFVRKSLQHFIKSVESSYLKLGLMGNTGNKGAVIIRMNIEKYGSIVITNVHLASGEQYHEERISQLKMILQSSIFNDPVQINGHLQPGNCLLDHDLVILAGDFNFRTQLPRQKVIELIQNEKFEELIYSDQFISECRTDPFSKLIEKKINFPPTYKYIKGENKYDQSRTPSWCDRIFVYRNNNNKSKYFINNKFDFNCISQKNKKEMSKNSDCFKNHTVEIIDYRSDQTYFLSDHRPVSAIISILFQF